MGCKCEKHFCNLKTPNTFHPTWMNEVPDHIPLSQLTIPGTHNSCAFTGGVMAVTQTWSIPLQLRAGLRYFDLRLRRYNKQLRFYHGIMNQCMGFEEVLTQFDTFLKEYPSETIIMAVQEEYNKCCTETSMTQLFSEYTKPYENVIVQYKGKDVLIGDIRGKILFVKAFHILATRITGFNVQNDWVVNFPSSIKDKKRKIKRHLNKAIVDVKSTKIYVNYLSGSSDYILVTPEKNAYQTNKVVFRFTGRLGVVLADFPGEELIDHLLKQNDFTEYPRQSEDGVVIESGMNVHIFNANTMKYLAVDKEKGFKCVKVPFVFRIEKDDWIKDQQDITQMNLIKEDNSSGGNGFVSGEEVKLCAVDEGSEVKLVVHSYERYLKKRCLEVVNKRNDSQQVQDKKDCIMNRERILLYMCNEDVSSTNTNKEQQYLCSDYIYNDSKLKIQNVIMNTNITDDGNQWLIYKV